MCAIPVGSFKECYPSDFHFSDLNHMHSYFGK